MSLELSDQYDKIYLFCYFKIHNRDVAEDITQETFLKYFETTQYLEKGKKLAFLYTIARNLCTDYFRKSSCEKKIDTLHEICMFESYEVETTVTIKDAVSELNKDDQEILLLRYTNELGIGEIAEYLGISRYAVYRRLNAVTTKLRSKLRREDFYE